MRYDLIEPYLTKKYHDEVMESKKTLCEVFDCVNMPMDNWTWCEIYLDYSTVQITSSSANPSHPGFRYSFIFYDDKVIVEMNFDGGSHYDERLEIPYDITEEQLFQLSTVCDIEGLDENVISTMTKIRDMYVRISK